MDSFTKAPDDALDYDVEFRRWLPVGDAIVAAVAAIEEAAATVVVDDTDFTADTVKVWLSAGADGEDATVKVTVTTGQARTKEHCFRLRVRDC